MDINKEDVITIFEDVLLGITKCFPRNYWSGNEGRERAKICTRYLMEEIFYYTEEDVKRYLRYETFTKNKLSGMLRRVYKDSPYNAINDAYNGKIKPWELQCCPMGFWDDKDNRIDGILWILNKNNINIENIERDLTALMFRDCGMCGLIDKYNGNLYKIIEEFNSHLKKVEKKVI